MTINVYLGELVAAQTLTSDELEILETHRNEITDLFRENFGEEPVIKYAGSRAKGTMIQESYDLDIVCYFPCTNEKTLKEIHDEVQAVLADSYNIIPKASAVRILGLKSGSEENQSYHIDVVPGRFVDETKQDAFLHVMYGEKERMQTNIKKHIKFISESGCRELIKLLKLWSHRNNISFKTFVLELFTVSSMEGFRDKDNYEKAFTKLLQDLAGQFEKMRLVDPANTNNIVTETMTGSEKKIVADQARADLKKIEKSDDLESWKDVFNDSDNRLSSEEDSVDAGSLPATVPSLEDYSHCQPPQWQNVVSSCAVTVYCSATSSRGHELGRIASNSIILSEDYKLKYEALVTGQPSGSEIFWQVVNTGDEAHTENALRGNFFKGHTLSGQPTSDQKINHETTRYTGKHWVECFVVNNDKLIARSGRFFVNIINQSSKRFRLKK